MPLEIADPTREIGVWLYDSASGVPVYVTQNPWTAFDPEGLAEFKIGPVYFKFFQDGVMGTCRMANVGDSHVPQALSLEAGKERAASFKASPTQFLKEAAEGYRSGRSDTPGSSFGNNVAVAETVAVVASMISRVGGGITPGPALATANGTIVQANGAVATGPSPLPTGALFQSAQDSSSASDSARKTAESNDAKGGTYKLKDSDTGQVRRTGITNDLDRREGEHARGEETKDLDFEVDRCSNNEMARRGREQRIHDLHPEADLNKRNPISPTNPKRDLYIKEGDKL